MQSNQYEVEDVLPTEGFCSDPWLFALQNFGENFENLFIKIFIFRLEGLNMNK